MTRTPNVILINADDLGYGDLSCYGSTQHDTPALDQMAAEGARFTDFYMASPVCSPSRAAMLTGSYPLRVGFGGRSIDNAPVLFPGQAQGLHPGEITIARLLQESGYATRIIGKWHCGDQPEFLPTRHGFDGWFGLPYSNDMGRQVQAEDVRPYFEIMKSLGTPVPADAPMLINRPPLPLMHDEEVVAEQPDQAGLTDLYVADALQFIRNNRNQPFFLYLAHLYVHLPIYVQDRFLNESRNGRYGAAVGCIDWSTKVLLNELRTLGIDQETVVIFTSDNGALIRDGGGSNGPLRASKGTTWEGGQRVPCIIRWPGRVHSGGVFNDVATAMDLFPTIASWCEVELPTDRFLDGRNLVGLLDGTCKLDDVPFFYILGGNIEAVRLGRWKFHVRKWNNQSLRLYDLDSDIGERFNVIEEHPDIASLLNGFIERARLDLGDDALNMRGSGVRPVGRVSNPELLTTFDPNSVYYMAEYDLAERG
ncbi:MAG: sulfatase [Acidimicrobiales bacterium]|nr:sulfatase [Acidimicrobiales bacterium]